MTTGLRPSSASFNSDSNNFGTALIANNNNNNNSSSSSSHDSVAGASSPQSLKLYQVVIFATPVLFAIILVLLFILFYLRRRRVRLVNARIRAQFLAGALFSPPGEQGLSKSFRAKLPIIPYDSSFAASTENTQCAVCLDEYAAGDKIQQLPVCGHAFHVECIDEWLAANLTCPICRTSCLLPPTPHGSSKLVTPSDASMMSGGDSSRGLAGAGSASRRWEERILSEIQDASSVNNYHHLLGIVAASNNNTSANVVGGSNNSSANNNTSSHNSLWMIRRDGSSIRGSNNNSNSNGSSLSDTALRVVNSEIFVHAINIERS